jgi:hypothetical protein
MCRPSEGDFGDFYRHYISLTKGNNPAELIAHHAEELALFFGQLPESLSNYAYAPGKWTVNQVLQHLIDTERIFTYRLVWIARGDERALPGFDENQFAAAAPASHLKLKDLVEEFLLLRKSTDLLLKGLMPEQLAKKGEASGCPLTANAQCFILFGHNLHHIQVLKERYLNYSA